METSEVIQKISAIKEIADAALQAIRRDKEAPQLLYESVAAFDMNLNQALSDVQKTNDPSSIVECIDELEESADRAKEALEHAGRTSEKTRTAVLRAHAEIARLKHQYH
jgi:hypothetical protein